MDQGEPDEEPTLEELFAHQLATSTLALNVLVKMLARLPIPIGLGHEVDDLTPELVIDGLDRARQLVLEEPMRVEAKLIMSMALLDWLTVWQLAVSSQEMGFTRWRLAVLTNAMERVTAELAQLDQVLPKPGQDR